MQCETLEFEIDMCYPQYWNLKQVSLFGGFHASGLYTNNLIKIFVLLIFVGLVKEILGEPRRFRAPRRVNFFSKMDGSWRVRWLLPF